MSRMCTKWVFVSLCTVNLSLAVLSSLFHSIVCLWIGNLDTSTWFFVMQLTVPFETSNIFNWYILLLMECLDFVVLNFMFSGVLTYFVGCCFYIKATCEHFRYDYRHIEEKIENKPKKADINAELIKAASLHVKIIE